MKTESHVKIDDGRSGKSWGEIGEEEIAAPPKIEKTLNKFDSAWNKLNLLSSLKYPALLLASQVIWICGALFLQAQLAKSPGSAGAYFSIFIVSWISLPFAGALTIYPYFKVGREKLQADAGTDAH